MYRAAHAPDILSTADFGGQRKKGGQGKAPQKCGGRAGKASQKASVELSMWTHYGYTGVRNCRTRYSPRWHGGRMKVKATINVEAGGPLIIDELEIGDPGPTHVIVKQFASGVCHSQLHQIHNPALPRPLVLGHESTGVVVATGRDVTHVAEGDQVMLTWVQRDRYPHTP